MSRTSVIILIGIGCLLAVPGLLMFRMQSVPGREFAETLENEISRQGFRMEQLSPTKSTQLPLLMRLRFPRDNSHGETGFPDVTMDYVFTQGTRQFSCKAHHRAYEVCYVEASREREVDQLAAAIHRIYPRLAMTRK